MGHARVEGDGHHSFRATDVATAISHRRHRQVRRQNCGKYPAYMFCDDIRFDRARRRSPARLKWSFRLIHWAQKHRHAYRDDTGFISRILSATPSPTITPLPRITRRRTNIVQRAINTHFYTSGKPGHMLDFKRPTAGAWPKRCYREAFADRFLLYAGCHIQATSRMPTLLTRGSLPELSLFPAQEGARARAMHSRCSIDAGRHRSIFHDFAAQ